MQPVNMQAVDVPRLLEGFHHEPDFSCEATRLGGELTNREVQ